MGSAARPNLPRYSWASLPPGGGGFILFNSLEFVLIFLPVTWLLWRLVVGRKENAGVVALLAASAAFYAHGEPILLSLLAGLIGVTFFLGRIVEARRSRLVLAIAVAVPLGALLWFKYAGFFSSCLHAWIPQVPVVAAAVLPLGISFFVFQMIAFLVDSYRGLTRADWLPRYALFISFFPQLIAGPIVHYRQIAPQLARKVMRKQADLGRGLFCFSVGLALKICGADTLAPYVDHLFEYATGWAVLLATLAYALQIYFDFNGYCVMAVGLGQMVGIRLPFNFDSPYKATSIIDFWRRWNITLSTFLRDYVYVPLGGNRRGKPRRYLNLMITMLLGGLWHGACANFVIWGGLHGLYLCIAHGVRRLGIPVPRLVGWTLTTAGVLVAWIFFRADSAGHALDLIQSMVWGWGTSQRFMLPDPATAVVMAIGWALVLFAPSSRALCERYKPTVPWVLFGALLLDASLTRLLYTGDVNEFIYFRF